MISVQLLSGDMNVSADGTVTAIDGNSRVRIRASLSGRWNDGAALRSFVCVGLAAQYSEIPFKISQPQEWMGTITQDRNTAIAGIVGRRAAMASLEIRSNGKTYHMEVIQDRVMTPLSRRWRSSP